ncbi:hypothetical protein O3M35_003071 [Rhynocoris fuscipes]|uniref:Uncharacterized protein n=1 Tax=Rhynocoris fuscipes TaxID=488301 RepID=A0AAW1CPL6_9HEMI
MQKSESVRLVRGTTCSAIGPRLRPTASTIINQRRLANKKAHPALLHQKAKYDLRSSSFESSTRSWTTSRNYKRSAFGGWRLSIRLRYCPHSSG